MKNSRTSVTLATALAAGLIALGGCSSMTRSERATAAGAVVGGVAGSVLSGGSTVGTVGGAAAGAVIGNQMEKRK